MDYFITGHSFADDIISILQLFYPNSVYTKIEELSENCIISSVSENKIYTALILKGQKISSGESPLPTEKAYIKKSLSCLFLIFLWIIIKFLCHGAL
ncbi:MAG: hypothetical protein LUD81_11140 [Clostridiales bacterium]|nr:hypothetical protein [Clostridiales bacterium]